MLNFSGAVGKKQQTKTKDPFIELLVSGRSVHLEIHVLKCYLILCIF